MPRIAVIDEISFGEDDLHALANLAGSEENLRDFHALGVPRTEDEILRRIGPAEVVLSSWTDFPRELIGRLSKVRLISMVATNVGGVDLEAASRAGILVTNVPDYARYSVSELVFGLALNLLRHIHIYDRDVRRGDAERARSLGTELHGLTLGVIGTGAIGSQVATIGRAIGMNVIAFTKHPSIERGNALSVHYVPLDVVLSDSDVVSIHVPLDETTRGMIGRREFSMMKRTAIFVYTSRPGICNEADLIHALQHGVIAGAGLDEFSSRLNPKTSPLLELPNVVLTPTIGYYTTEAVKRLHAEAIENVASYLRGTPRNAVNTVLPTPRESGA